MGWFPVNRRAGAALALIALVLQFAASFAHVHVPGAKGSTVAPLVGGVLHTAEDHDHGHDRGTPDGGVPHARVGCDVCTLLGLIGAPPAAPTLLLARLAGPAAPITTAREIFAERRFSHAQSRAPPAA